MWEAALCVSVRSRGSDNVSPLAEPEESYLTGREEDESGKRGR